MSEGQAGRLSNNSIGSSRRRFLAASAALMGASTVFGQEKEVRKPEAKTDPGASEAKPAPAANPAAAATTQNSKLRLALVGAGGQGRYDMRNYLSCKEEVVAICDVD